MKWLFLLLLVGCGIEENHGQWFEPELQPYIDEFDNLGAQYGYSSSVVNEAVIRDTLAIPTAIGVQITKANGKIIVQVLRSWWESAPEIRKHVLILHEFGHAVGFDHRRELYETEDGRLYKSIMYPAVLSERMAEEFYDLLVVELFAPHLFTDRRFTNLHNEDCQHMNDGSVVCPVFDE